MKLDGKILKEQREIMGISIAEMSRRSGLSRPTIYSYESMTDDCQISKLLEAYMLEVYPTVGSMPADINEILNRIEQYVQMTFASKCKVKISIELCGEEK